MRKEVVELVNSLCQGFETLLENIPKDSAPVFEAIAEKFEQEFPEEVKIDYIVGTLQTILHFADHEAPEETRIYAALYGTALGRAIAGGRVKVL